MAHNQEELVLLRLGITVRVIRLVLSPENLLGKGNQDSRRMIQPQQEEANNIETFEQEFRCLVCNEPGHRASQCLTNVCYRCNGYGHLAEVCPSSRNVTFCYKCGTQGVTVRDCPISNDTQPQQQGNEEAGSQ